MWAKMQKWSDYAPTVTGLPAQLLFGVCLLHNIAVLQSEGYGYVSIYTVDFTSFCFVALESQHEREP